jgi:hypothetical protein
MVRNGTTYSDGTPDGVVQALESARAGKYRIRVWYGRDGKCWNEEHDIIGRVSRSIGPHPVPILIHNSRSMGGPAILTGCIVRINRTPTMTVYKAPDVKFDRFISTAIGTVYNETTDTLYARCKNGDTGKRLAAYMNGDRWAK